jgi:hypothetical protein
VAIDGGDGEVLRNREREPATEGAGRHLVREPLLQHELLQMVRHTSDRNIRRWEVVKGRSVALGVPDFQQIVDRARGRRITRGADISTLEPRC